MKHDKKKRIKKQLIERYGYCCQICGEKTTKEKLAIEHIIPKSSGGKNNKENLSLVCNSCNSKKHKYNALNYPQNAFFKNPIFFINLCMYENSNSLFDKEMTLENLKGIETNTINKLNTVKEVIKFVKNIEVRNENNND